MESDLSFTLAGGGKREMWHHIMYLQAFKPLPSRSQIGPSVLLPRKG